MPPLSAARPSWSMVAGSLCLECKDSARNLTDRKANLSAGLPLQAVLISIAIHALWGGNPVAVKLGLAVFPPMWSAFIRFAIATVCVAVWAGYRGIPLWPKRVYWPVLLLVSTVFTIQIRNHEYRLQPGERYSIGCTAVHQPVVRCAVCALSSYSGPPGRAQSGRSADRLCRCCGGALAWHRYGRTGCHRGGRLRRADRVYAAWLAPGSDGQATADYR